jgi:aspartyl-tRNA(Asn)/glutamyl-tRNA(Gln) amidotransferase subunit C
MDITKQDVEKVALLARLRVTEDERAVFATQLSQILTHVEQLNRYDTAGVEPTTTVMGQLNVFRDDVARPSLSVEQALANAPEREGDGFGVPKILEER